VPEQTLPQSNLTAEQLLSRMLDLIISSSDISDFTEERVARSIGLQLMPYQDVEFGARAQLTPAWWYRLEGIRSYKGEPELQLSFEESDGDRAAPMTDIAQVDVDRFSRELESAGFTRQTWYGEHGRQLGEYFDRKQLHVTVGTRGESSENAGHQCVQFVRIH
jgi:hypothetical protein